MARPTTKKDLVIAANEQYIKLINLINTMSREEQTKEFTFDIQGEKEAHWKRDKNIRDVLIHLYEWHQLLLNWVDSNMKGNSKQFLLEPYNWKTYGDMNVELWKKHQNTSYDDSKKMLEKSHFEVMNLIEKFSNEELFEKGIFKWTGGNAIGSYCVSVSCSHYDWAIKKIKKHIKSL